MLGRADGSVRRRAWQVADRDRLGWLALGAGAVTMAAEVPGEPSWPIAQARPPRTTARRASTTSAGSTSRAQQLKTRPDDPGALLWLAANLAGEALTHGRLFALRVIPQIESTLLRLEQSTPTYDHAAAARALANLYWKAPAFISVGSSTKATRYFRWPSAGLPTSRGTRRWRPPSSPTRAIVRGRDRWRWPSSAAAIPTRSGWTPPSGGSWPTRPCPLPLSRRATRVLFVCEAVTLAQVVRLATLARALDPARYEVHFASARFDELIFAGTAFTRHHIHSLPARTSRPASPPAAGSTAAARWPATSTRNARCSRRSSQLWWSATCGCRCPSRRPLERVPYAALINAYWSPQRGARRSFRSPTIRSCGCWACAAAQLLSEGPAACLPALCPTRERASQASRPAAAGQPARVLTHGDHTLFPDVPALVPTRDLPARQRYLGPVLWSPPVPLPPWWTRWIRSARRST